MPNNKIMGPRVLLSTAKPTVPCLKIVVIVAYHWLGRLTIALYVLKTLNSPLADNGSCYEDDTPYP